MSLDHRTPYVNTIRSGISVLVYPLQYLVSLPSGLGNWASSTFASREQLQQENQELRAQNELLRAQLQKLTFIESENIHLRSLLQSSRRAGERILIAELLSVDMDPFKHQVLLNKGSNNNDIYTNQPIVDANGVMGKLVTVGPVSSTALLITDPNHSLPVQINRNGLRAIATGTGSKNRLQIPYLPNNADIRVGDLLVTSGLGCVFPAGYPVATVREVNINPSLPFAEVIAEPSAQLERSRQVLLVWPSGKTPEDTQAPCGQVAGENAGENNEEKPNEPAPETR